MGEFAVERVPVEIWEHIIGSFIEEDVYFQSGSQMRSFKLFREQTAALSRKTTEWRTLRCVCRAWAAYIDGRTLFIDGEWVHRSRHFWASFTIARARRIKYDYSAFDSCLLVPTRWSVVEMDLRTSGDLSSFRSLASFSHNHPIKRLQVTIYQAIDHLAAAFISDLNCFNDLVYLSLVDHSQFTPWWPHQCILTLPRLEALEWSIVDFPSPHRVQLPALRHLYLRRLGRINQLSIWDLIRPYAPTLRSLLLHDYKNETLGYSLKSLPWVLFPRLEELSLSLPDVTALVVSRSLPDAAHPLKRLYVYMSIGGSSSQVKSLHSITRLAGGIESVHLMVRGTKYGLWPVPNLRGFVELSQICAKRGVRLEDGHGESITELLNGLRG